MRVHDPMKDQQLIHDEPHINAWVERFEEQHQNLLVMTTTQMYKDEPDQTEMMRLLP